jgi:hypothetical protein
MVTAHAPVPLHAPLHPANVEPTAGVAVRITGVPAAYVAEHVAPQLIPAGLLVTVPSPVPTLFTDRATSVKVAVAVWPLLTVTTHVPVPLHGPLHPTKIDPTAGVAVRVTIVPAA